VPRLDRAPEVKAIRRKLGELAAAVSQVPPVTGETVNDTAGALTLTSASDPGGTFTTPPAGTLGTGATDHWTATVPSSGAITVTYAFDGAHSVTFTDAGTSLNCAITPVDPGYACTASGSPQAPVDTLTGAAAAPRAPIGR
jgi:hypothetical protein